MSSKWDLILAAYSPATRLKYDGAHQRFREWASSSPLFHSLLLRVIDSLLSDYLYDLFHRGVGKGEATCALFGTIMYYPRLKDALPLSRAVLRGYSSMKVSTPHPPMPWTVCTSLAFWLAMNKKFPLAVAVLLSFDCYLRIGECIALLKDDVAFGGDPRLGLSRSDRVHINIRAAKTGVLQGVEVRDPQVKELIRLWHDRTRALASSHSLSPLIASGTPGMRGIEGVPLHPTFPPSWWGHQGLSGWRGHRGHYGSWSVEKHQDDDSLHPTGSPADAAEQGSRIRGVLRGVWSQRSWSLH